ncbi:MAG: class I SAM-dependent methyltransferase [Spirochaetes bacterium]|nr:class I SAM-dependent methyltransferase [Spirochaetota bacterium]
MDSIIERINSLDITLYDKILSETADVERRSLLAIQRTIAADQGEYSYLEIGSHLGGSIQPHLLDSRCTRIYSIDPRPYDMPDERSKGCVVCYDNNSTERMLNLLRAIDSKAVEKIQCIESDSSSVDPNDIQIKPSIIFIDGVHTKTAVLSDYDFASKVISKNGAIVFHDFQIIYSAIHEICCHLKRKGIDHIALLLEGNVFSIFFNPDHVRSDPYLTNMVKKNRFFFWPRYYIKRLVKKILGVS